ncbi:MAG: hypothetical protein OEZ41_11470, partial [Nitrospirota bacterium]|nr:hypothetical protein [Nitrospirota bacterium]
QASLKRRSILLRCRWAMGEDGGASPQQQLGPLLSTLQQPGRGWRGGVRVDGQAFAERAVTGE